MKTQGQQVLFVTGTDTDVGKTVFTIRLLRELRLHGTSAIALKPFCSGDRQDARRLVAEINSEKTLEEINPYHTKKPIAPGVQCLVKGGATGRNLREILSKIKKAAAGYDWVIVEGAGGVLVPLTQKLMVIDLIQALNCAAIVVARNELGTINHSLLTVFALRKRKIPVRAIVLMESCEKDSSQKTNKSVISQLSGNLDVISFPRLSAYPKLRGETAVAERILKITLAKIWGPRIVWPR